MGIFKLNGIDYMGGGGQSFQPVIYSTEEREIGVWTDGKPLYQKCIDLTGVSLVRNTYTPVSTISDINTLVSAEAVGYENTTGTPFPTDTIRVHIISGGIIEIVTSSSAWNFTGGMLTVQYTKTTDTPGSGTWTPSGVPAVHYSTDEQVVGTWIDDSTVYERVIEYATPFTIANDTWYTSTESYTGISKIVNAWIINVDGAIYNGIIVLIQNDKLVIGNQTKTQPINNIKYVILRYTKSTI